MLHAAKQLHLFYLGCFRAMIRLFSRRAGTESLENGKCWQSFDAVSANSFVFIKSSHPRITQPTQSFSVLQFITEVVAAANRPETRFALFCYELLALANLDF